jgi:hypothetical protein
VWKLQFIHLSLQAEPEITIVPKTVAFLKTSAIDIEYIMINM